MSHVSVSCFAEGALQQIYHAFAGAVASGQEEGFAIAGMDLFQFRHEATAETAWGTTRGRRASEGGCYWEE